MRRHSGINADLSALVMRVLQEDPYAGMAAGPAAVASGIRIEWGD